MARSGQVIILTVLTLGGTLLGATTIAGLLMLYQLRQATDLGNSGKAIFAADSGIEWALFAVVNPDAPALQRNLPNGASVEVKCFDENNVSLGCSYDNAGKIHFVKSVGTATNSSRAFGLSL